MWSIMLVVGLITVLVVMVGASNPLTLGLGVFVAVVITSFSVCAGGASWAGVVLFFVFVGGLMVIFAYFICLSPNQQISVNFSMGVIMGATMYKVLYDCGVLSLWGVEGLNLGGGGCWGLSIFFVGEGVLMLVLLGFSLLLCLIVVTKVVKVNSGPLRHFVGH